MGLVNRSSYLRNLDYITILKQYNKSRNRKAFALTSRDHESESQLCNSYPWPGVQRSKMNCRVYFFGGEGGREGGISQLWLSMSTCRWKRANSCAMLLCDLAWAAVCSGLTLPGWYLAGGWELVKNKLGRKSRKKAEKKKKNATLPRITCNPDEESLFIPGSWGGNVPEVPQPLSFRNSIVLTSLCLRTQVLE